MSNRVDDLLEKYFIKNITEKKEKKIGIEVELPVVHMNQKPLEIDFAVDFMRHMQIHGFYPKERTAEGFCYKAVNKKGDVISFDTTWNIIEFSLKQEISIVMLASRFYDYIETAQKHAKAKGYDICGRGLHPYAEYIDITPINTKELMAKSRFLNQFTTHKDGDIFFAIPASTQTHIDCSASEYVDTFDFLRKLIFLDSCLFANSLSPEETLVKKHPVLDRASRTTLCYRDEIYRLSEAPNTQPDTREICTFSDLKEYLKQLNIFIVRDENQGFEPMIPQSFEQYFQNSNCPEDDIACFRSLEPISPSKYGTLELRGICTQPMTEIFQPTAFYVGLLEMKKQTSILLQEFQMEQRCQFSPMELRRLIVNGFPIVEHETKQKFLKELVACSYEGLRKRGLAEEQFLHSLHESNCIRTPAERELRYRNSGMPLSEIIKMFSAW